VKHCTISGNTAVAGPSGGFFSLSLFEDPTQNIIENSIISGNSGQDLAGEPANIAAHNHLGPVCARLAPLANYGGRTKTMPPLPGSPVIDAGIALASSPATDQRGAPRPNGPLPDIGAVEAFPFSSLALIDSDGDGIDDRLEPACGLIVGVDDSLRDSDGDGSPDAVEIANMTDPLDPGSFLKISSFTRAAGFDPVSNPVFDLTFTSFPGLSYSLEQSQNLGFHSPSGASHPLGKAVDSTTSARATLPPGGGFLRIRRDP
jgi:hypothetical protein